MRHRLRRSGKSSETAKSRYRLVSQWRMMARARRPAGAQRSTESRSRRSQSSFLSGHLQLRAAQWRRSQPLKWPGSSIRASTCLPCMTARTFLTHRHRVPPSNWVVKRHRVWPRSFLLKIILRSTCWPACIGILESREYTTHRN